MKNNPSLLEELSKIRRDLTGLEAAPREPDPLSAFFFAMEGLSEMVVITDLAHKIVYVNAACANLLGYNPEELMGMKADKYFEGIPGNPPDLAGMISAAASGGFWQGEIFNRRKDGDLITINLKLTPLADSSGQVLGYVGISENITKRKQAEEALRESEAQNRAILNAQPDLMFLQSRDGIFLDYHASCTDTLYVPPEQFLGKRMQDIFPEELSTLFLDLIEQVLATGKMRNHEYMLPIAGQSQYFEIRIVPCGDDKILSIIRDITDRKRMEKEILKSRKLESLGTLAGGIAHDFNNILTAILGNVSYARVYAEEGSELYKPIVEAEAGCLRARGLTKQLLTFSRGGEPVKKVIRIGELLKESTEFALHGSNVICRFEIALNLWPVEADRGQLDQVISNLVINSDQSLAAGGKMHMRAENVELEKGDLSSLEAGRYVKIEVEDEGVGILAEHLEKIFDPYFTTKQKGSGLGLASAYSIVINHSGALRAVSEPGKGSTFIIYLPASKEEPQEKKVSEDIILGEGRVLLMDDEAEIRQMAARLIGKLGYEVETAADGQEAIEKYRKSRSAGRPFGVVILDLTVKGGMGGEKALDRLKEIDPEVKAIVSSGYSIDSVMSHYRYTGFAGMIAKPYSLSDISRILSAEMK